MVYDPDDGELFDFHPPTSVHDFLSQCLFNTLAAGVAGLLIAVHYAKCPPVRNAIRRRRAWKKSQRAERARLEMLPVPLPLTRKRELSWPLPVPGESGLQGQRQATNSQLQSLFFKLPLEIREVIYNYALSAGNPGFVIHVQARPKRVGHSCGKVVDWGTRGLSNGSPIALPALCNNHTRDGFLALLRTCRKVYSEAISILYSKPTFFFSDPQDVTLFASSVLPRRLDAVQFMEIVWDGISLDRAPLHAWVHAWITISQMKGLKEMRVRLHIRNLVNAFTDREMVLRPMTRVSGLDVFELTLPLENPEDVRNWAFLKGMQIPFKIV